MIQVTKEMIAIGSVAFGAISGGYTWDLNQRAAAHDDLETHFAAAGVELDLKLVELELKFLRDIEARRELSLDERDRRSYLEEVRRVLIEEQRG